MGRPGTGCGPRLVALVACLCLHASSGVLANRDVQGSDEITLKREQIFVNVLDGGPTFSLMVELEQTVLDLNHDLNELEGIPKDWIETAVGSTKLTDRFSKLHEHIGPGGVVTVSIQEKRKRKYTTEQTVIVRTLDGREFPVTTLLVNTVASLKDNITQWAGIPRAEQRLLLKGKELKDERKLVHYGADSGAILELGRPLEDCLRVVPIIVKTLSGATIKLEVNLADTVTELKEKIRAKAGVPTSVQRLHNHERVITGEDHLCDLGLEANSTVYMWLYSARVTSPDQLYKLREPCSNDPNPSPNKAPIFHEAEDAAESVQSGCRSAWIFKDVRNWIIRHNGPRPFWDFEKFDPVEHLSPNPDREESIEEYRRSLTVHSLPDLGERERLKVPLIKARIKLAEALRPYCAAAILNPVNNIERNPGMTLGGGFTDVSPKRPISLGADVNNWAPDVFSDSDVMRLFEVSERVRQVLARDAQTGQGTLSIAGQNRINRSILNSYHVALMDYPPSVEYDQPRENEECRVCRDALTAEPALKLPCEHTFHSDCIVPWVANENQEYNVPRCPYCKQRFRFPYQALGTAELEAPELQIPQ